MPEIPEHGRDRNPQRQREQRARHAIERSKQMSDPDEGGRAKSSRHCHFADDAIAPRWASVGHPAAGDARMNPTKSLSRQVLRQQHRGVEVLCRIERSLQRLSTAKRVRKMPRGFVEAHDSDATR
jgi:hypothetical protein